MTENITKHDLSRKILMNLRIPLHHNGYAQLCIGIPYYKPGMSVTKELYPYIGKQCGCNSKDVECSIRRAILYGWEYGDREIWMKYFPRYDKTPSNKIFIATLAEYL